MHLQQETPLRWQCRGVGPAGRGWTRSCGGPRTLGGVVARRRQASASTGGAAEALGTCTGNGGCASLSGCAGEADGSVGVVCWAGCAVHLQQTPPLLVEDAVRVRTSTRCHAANVMHVWAAIAILPPLVGELEDQPSGADTAAHRCVVHNLLSEHRGGMGLRPLVQTPVDEVVSVGPVLSQEHRSGGHGLPAVKQVGEGELVVVVDAPDVDV
mmetsp:Transcript_62634/g.140910  ORF Transcript_62634/g.140910 Transcript_62634/m.140910 type:complete len:212 (-) Transcript_62634:480-1115(-)